MGEAASPDGVAGYFDAGGGGSILIGAGPSGATFRVDSPGNVFATSYNVGGADFAESFAVAGDREDYEPGDVLVIDPAGTRRLGLSAETYSTLVAGVFDEAGRAG
ncbi:MAG: hypothetical protein ACRD24_14010 [Terriglobales bacterium]